MHVLVIKECMAEITPIRRCTRLAFLSITADFRASCLLAVTMCERDNNDAIVPFAIIRVLISKIKLNALISALSIYLDHFGDGK